jgi:hypothetical protein
MMSVPVYFWCVRERGREGEREKRERETSVFCKRK